MLKSFVAALPDRIPEEIDRFAAHVSPRVQVFEQGRLVHGNRDSWFARLRSLAGRAPGDPRGISISREAFYRTVDGSIAVLEFSYPIPPAGMEGQVTYHPPHPLQLVTYRLEGGRLVRVDYGPAMQSYDYLLKAGGPATPVAVAAACPQQPEPRALQSAALNIPTEGRVLLFSAAPSFLSMRYALRVVSRPGTAPAWATLVRLRRRADCNVHDRAGQWDFELDRAEWQALSQAAETLRRNDPSSSEIATDGTSVEVQLYANGNKQFDYYSNGTAKDRLSETVLRVVRRHVPPSEMPADLDWRYKLPGTAL